MQIKIMSLDGTVISVTELPVVSPPLNRNDYIAMAVAASQENDARHAVIGTNLDDAESGDQVANTAASGGVLLFCNETLRGK